MTSGFVHSLRDLAALEISHVRRYSWWTTPSLLDDRVELWTSSAALAFGDEVGHVELAVVDLAERTLEQIDLALFDGLADGVRGFLAEHVDLATGRLTAAMDALVTAGPARAVVVRDVWVERDWGELGPAVLTSVLWDLRRVARFALVGPEQLGRVRWWPGQREHAGLRSWAGLHVADLQDQRLLRPTREVLRHYEGAGVCGAVTTLPEEALRELAAVPGGRLVPRLDAECVLEPGHGGADPRHCARVQIAGDEHHWVLWDECGRDLVVRPQCLIPPPRRGGPALLRAVLDPDAEHPPLCAFPAGHSGRHQFEFGQGRPRPRIDFHTRGGAEIEVRYSESGIEVRDVDAHP
ncbi:hypothetical protein GCM10017786_47910 [Amycolatopsis deserti]|uniref:Uncharacterized protein n=1 Tax=Amycolatopsis deserti TaxID=185696 RepID=A0ABQ3J7D7_9PSEU|nr:hypothetical protein [Amycolatopsis deserti]GHF08532.1 hypothetical protein GCM10017786_47910 [Amycolatopsis deserti]